MPQPSHLLALMLPTPRGDDGPEPTSKTTRRKRLAVHSRPAWRVQREAACLRDQLGARTSQAALGALEVSGRIGFRFAPSFCVRRFERADGARTIETISLHIPLRDGGAVDQLIVGEHSPFIQTDRHFRHTSPKFNFRASSAARSAAVACVYRSSMLLLDQPAIDMRPPSEPPAASHRVAAVLRSRCR